MTSTAAALGLFCACIALLLAAEQRPSPSSLLLLSYFPTLLGYQDIAGRFGPAPLGWIVYVAPVAFSVGVASYSFFWRRRCAVVRVVAAPRAAPVTWVSPVAVIFGVLSLLASIHFLRAGIPLFSANVETTRFALGTSGLFGLPSRAVLFGIPIIALIAGVRAEALPRQLVRAIWVVLVFTRMALGFKGSLVEVAILAVTVFLIRGSLLRARTALVLLSLVLAAWSYGLAIGDRYTTIAGSGGVSVDYVVSRATVGAAWPAWYALNLGHTPTDYVPYALHDLAYFARHYFSVGDGPIFAADQLVSSFITGTPREVSNLLVPVTIGGPAYAALSVGGALSVLVFTVFGGLWAWAIRAVRSGPPSSVLLAAVVLLAGRVFYMNGGAVYLATNYMFVAALIASLFVLATRLMGMRRSAGATRPALPGGS